MDMFLRLLGNGCFKNEPEKATTSQEHRLSFSLKVFFFFLMSAFFFFLNYGKNANFLTQETLTIQLQWSTFGH